jgi:subtilisin family serine protease
MAVVSSLELDDDERELAGLAVATLPDQEVTPALLRTVEASPVVEWAEPLPIRWLAANGGADPMRNLQWALRAIRWFDAPRPAASETTVGIMDTGIDRNHPDIRAVAVTYDHPGVTSTDVVGHGTHVAGIVAATSGNDVGITGVAACRLRVWKIFGDEPDADGEFYVDSERYYAALREAGNADLASLNLSIGGMDRFQTEELLLRRLIRGGVTVCAAMGNEYDQGDPTEYPAAFDDVVSVGAMGEDLRRSSFSNTGNHIDLVAPGSHILSTVPRKASPYRTETNYVSWNGTSMATPHVSAAAALVAAANPSLERPKIVARLRDTAETLPVMRGRAWTREYGTGLLNLTAALS